MNILWVDDEPWALGDCVYSLRQAGHSIDFAETLVAAYQRLTPADANGCGQPDFDLVIIDLWLDTAVPPPLQSYYRGLEPGTNNDGQSLGQWLWELTGAHQSSNGPIHCYISSFPEFYRRHSVAAKQEFFGADDSRLILSKFEAKPSQIANQLDQVVDKWKTLRHVTPSAALAQKAKP